jgi:hypothetical protein
MLEYFFGSSVGWARHRGPITQPHDGHVALCPAYVYGNSLKGRRRVWHCPTPPSDFPAEFTEFRPLYVIRLSSHQISRPADRIFPAESTESQPVHRIRPPSHQISPPSHRIFPTESTEFRLVYAIRPIANLISLRDPLKLLSHFP